MKKLLITGASGFIGSHVVRQAIKAGHKVTVLALPDDPMPRLQEVASDIHVVHGNLLKPETYRAALQNDPPEACIHLAWYTEPGKYQQSSQNIAWLKSSLDLTDILIGIRCPRIVMAGTCAEYAISDTILTENSPTNPSTLYGACKLALLHVASRLSAQAGISFAWGRVFYLYGPHEHPHRLVPSLIRALMAGERFQTSSGEQIRDFLHVDDVARAFLCLATHLEEGIFNICSGTGIRIRDLIETTAASIGRTGSIEYGARPAETWDPPRVIGDNARLISLTWRPEHSIETGLADTARWCNKQMPPCFQRQAIPATQWKMSR